MPAEIRSRPDDAIAAHAMASTVPSLAAVIGSGQSVRRHQMIPNPARSSRYAARIAPSGRTRVRVLKIRCSIENGLYNTIANTIAAIAGNGLNSLVTSMRRNVSAASATQTVG